jgi:putative transcriptional regulator
MKYTKASRVRTGGPRAFKTDRSRLIALKAMTDDAVEAVAASDPDAQPLSARDPARMRSLSEIDVWPLRNRRGLSQAQFAARFGFVVKTVEDWEQGLRNPVGPARVLLNMIARDPRAVERLTAHSS